MTRIDGQDIADTTLAWSLTIIEPGSAEPDGLPDAWRPITATDDPAVRLEAAVSLWNADFLALIPRFADALRSRFLDVRVGVTDEGLPALAYVAQAANGTGYVTWVGYTPAAFGETPPFWENFPPPLQSFLRTVHAGFTCETRTSFGPCRPWYMQTLADRAGFPDGIPGWDDDAEISSTRLLQITDDGGMLRFCISPDVGPGELALVDEGEVDPVPLGPELDKLLMWRLEN